MIGFQVNPPSGQTVTVSVVGASSNAAVQMYYDEAATVAAPTSVAITTPVIFYLAAAGVYGVSMKIGGVEYGSSAGTPQIVNLSAGSAPILTTTYNFGTVFAPLHSPAFTGLPSINGSVLDYISPSGDTTGVTDTTNIQNALNAGYTVLLGHNPGTFYVTNIVLPAGATIRGAGSGLTTFLPGSSASGSVHSGSMFYYSGTAAVFLSGFTCNGNDGVYNYLLNFTDLGSFAADFPIIEDCQFISIFGTGLYYGGNRGGLRASNCSFSGCSTLGAHIGGSDVILDHPEVSYNGHGLEIFGSMTRVYDMDCYFNNFGVYVHIPQVWIVRASFDQNNGSGVVVDTNASTVFISGRFTSNGLATTNTYPNVDIHSAAPLGVTLLPDTFFLGLAFGHTQTTTYDVYTNGVSFYDYSQWSGTSSTSGHSDYAGAAVLTPTFANGMAAQLSDTTRVYTVYLNVTTAGTATTLAIGPTSGVANVIKASSVATLGDVYTVRLPAGWFLKWAGTTTAIATQVAVSC